MLEIRLLGELEVRRDGSAVPLPASRKSRALLGLLAASGKPQSRERLCEVLWDGPDDPRAQLRWSLTKLRPLIGPTLIATRDRVELRRDGIGIDLAQICTPATAKTATLESDAELFRGEFLEGLDLPGCFRYQQWCAGERERFRKLHIEILTELTRRHGVSEAALLHARRRVMIDPFDDEGHAALIRLLAALGDGAEALRQYEQSRRLFERELRSSAPAIEEARRSIWSAPPAASRSEPQQTSDARTHAFVGRQSVIDSIRGTSDPVLILGEPGIGKSRLVEELRPHLYARAFASEMIRPYGVWLDALGDLPAESDRDRLFQSVLARVRGTIAIDDLQWIDEASAALLHYVARKGDVRIILAARVGEIEDNRSALRLIDGIRPREISLGPLSADETRQLVADERIVEQCGGNPLFALELSRAGGASGGLSRLIAARLDRLQGAARELVSWAAAIGRQFEAEIVGRATGVSAGEMLAALERLEHAAIIRASGDRRYDFTHDLIRDVAYQMVSAPRRALLHRNIALAFRQTHDPDSALAGDILHHAWLAGDAELAAAAAIEAGRRCLRVFAYREAMVVAHRGLQIAESLAGSKRTEIEMNLFEIVVMARTPVGERMEYAGRIAALAENARRTGLSSAAGLGAHLLAFLHHETNNYARAAAETRASAEIARTADPKIAAATMGNSAACLLLLQRDVARAEELVTQARAIGSPNVALSVAIGFLHAHQGRVDEAMAELEEAHAIAARKQDHWREWLALSRMVTIQLESGDARRALGYCERLRPVAAKMSGGSEGVRTDVLEIAARFACGEDTDIDAALDRLRAADCKSDLAWVLTFLASRIHDAHRARRYAAEALEAAECVGRESEAVIARCLLGRPAKASPDITARARRFLKERRHGHSRPRAVV